MSFYAKLCCEYKSLTSIHIGVRHMKKLITTLSLGLILSGCVTTGGPNQTAGTLLGGAGGALIGQRFGHGKGRIATTALGTLGGAMLGGYVGQTMDTPPQQPQPQYAYPPEYMYEPHYAPPPRPSHRHKRSCAPRHYHPPVYYERETYYY